MKKILLSLAICLIGITASYEAAHALNPHTVMREAKSGLATSQFLLGLLYTTGAESDVIEVDPHKARKWYEKAALQGHLVAQLALAAIYEQGDNVERDLEKAAMWYEKAAIQGAALAQFRLGEFYEKGLGVKQDLEKSIAWYEKAAAQNYAEAKARLENLKKQMAEAQKAQADAVQPAGSAKPE